MSETKKILPKYTTSEFNLKLPVSGKEVIFKAYTVGDEKTLLAAVSAKDDDVKYYVTNIINTIQNCICNDIDVKQLPSADVRYLLLHIRSKSVGQDIEIKYKDKPLTLDIDKFYVKITNTPDDYKIKLNDEFGLKMKDITFGDETTALSTLTEETKNNYIFKIVLKSITEVYDKKDVWYVGQDISEDDLDSFISQIPARDAQPIFEFIKDMPVLAIDVDIDGEKKTITNLDVDFLSSASATTR